ncbi:MAG: DUF302 domain-containing protein, partial [Hyphomicrobium sp.]
MAYYFSKIVTSTFDDAVDRAIVALKVERFGIITQIDIQNTLQDKLGVTFRKYRILGACNPKLALEALEL